MQVPSSSEGGDDRPTFFELVAADKLMPSLRAALVYSVGVLVSRRPSLARLLDHEDEAFALFMLLVEWHSFATSDGSLAEGLYGLQRTRARGSRAPRTEPASRRQPRENAARRMTKSQRIASVALLVGVPYARAKLDKLYARLARARGLEHATDADAVAGAILGEDAGGGAQQSPGGRIQEGTGASSASARLASAPSEDDSAAEESLATRRGLLAAFGRFTTSARGGLGVGFAGGGRAGADSREWRLSRRRGVRGEDLFVRAYPLAHAAWEAATLAHWVRFLLGGGETHDPALALAGLRVARTSAREAMQRRLELESARAEAVAGARAAPWFAARLAGPPLLRARHFAADYAQGGLMLCVVGFKLMEWWYGSAEEKVTSSLVLPVPPPPPVPPPHRDGVAPTRGSCPLCGASPAATPAAPACSGYACCHACLTAHIREHGACPVTLLPARLEDVRKLFSE